MISYSLPKPYTLSLRLGPTYTGELSQGIAYAALAGASSLNCILALLTLAHILRRRVRPGDWGLPYQIGARV